MTEQRLKEIEARDKQPYVLELIAAVRLLSTECGELRSEATSLRAENERLTNQYAEQLALARHRAVANGALRSLLREARPHLPCRCNPEHNCYQCKLSKRIDAALGEE